MNTNTPDHRLGFTRTLAAACLLAVILACLSIRPTAGQALSTLYVTPAGTDDCSSWASACGLQTAINAAQPGSEIWVAAGTYKPNSGADRTATFTLKDGVAVYGGFAGNETDRSERDWAANETILSGVIGVLNNPSNNSLHVLKGSGLTASTVLDGLTINGGNANASGTEACGGGLYLSGSSPTLANLTFRQNHALARGGALYIDGGSPACFNCSFIENTSAGSGYAVYMTNNSALFQGGEVRGNSGDGYGAFTIDWSFSGVDILGVTFSGNTGYAGAAVSVSFSNVSLTDVTFTGNHALHEGGTVYITGMYTTRIDGAVLDSNTAGRGGALYDASHDGAEIANAVFTHNESMQWGGAVHSYQAPMRIINSTFYQNKAGERGGAVSSIADCSKIRNSIIWGNTAPVSPQVDGYSCIPNLGYSFVQGEATDNTKKVYGVYDPQFISTAEGSLDLRLKAFSPAIDWGSAWDLPPNTLLDMDGNPRIVGGAVDLGAYEQQNPNHQPALLKASLRLPDLMEDPAVNEGIRVRDLIHGAGTDADGDDLGMVTLTAAEEDSRGFWEYSTPDSWLPLHTGTDSGRYLAPDTRIRFHPAEHWHGTLQNGLTFRLWDRADGGETGGLINASAVFGPAAPFSAETGTVTITVLAVNDAPVNEAAPFLTGAPMPGETLTANPGIWSDFDTENPVFTFTYQWQVRETADGTPMDIPGATDGSYTPTAADLGRYISCVVTATDNGVGQPPSMSASAESNMMEIGSLLEIIAEGSDAAVTMDEEGDPQSFALQLHALDGIIPEWRINTLPAHGSAAVDASGAVSYWPLPDFNGSDQFVVAAQAGPVVDTITVSVTIRPRNDAPYWIEYPELDGPARFGLPISADPGVWSDDRDLNPGSLTYTYHWQFALKDYGPVWTDIAGATGLTYTPKASDVNHFLRFMVRVTDDGEGLPAAMVYQATTFPVQVTNTAPVIAEGTLLNVTASPVQLHATDADGNPLAWKIHSPPSHGSASVDANGLVTYSLYPNCTGMDEFTVRVDDGAASDTITIRPPGGTCRFYVDDTAIGADNGSSWPDAFTSLQKAIGESAAGDEIWVAVGVYYPTTSTNRWVSFALKEGVEMYGGFLGTETDLTQRDWRGPAAILSGNIGDSATNLDNSFHVVTGTNLTAATVLDGFFITAGNAIGPNDQDKRGGGIFNDDHSSPTLRNLLIQGNEAKLGGGMYNSTYSSPLVSQVEFSENLAAYAGGGMNNDDYSSPTVTDVVFYQNGAGDKGGGMYNGSYSNPHLRRVLFRENSAGLESAGAGGGMENYYSSPQLVDVEFSLNTSYTGGGMSGMDSGAALFNVQFLGNQAAYQGGAVYLTDRSDVIVTNAVFYGNTAEGSGGAIAAQQYSEINLIHATMYLNEAKTGGAIYNAAYTSAAVRNSILWRNQAVTYPEANTATFYHAIVQGVANNPAAGVYGDEAHNPRLAAPDSGYFHLLSDSPAIDAGMNSWLPTDAADMDEDGDTAEPLPLDLGGSDRLRGDAVDLGAYEYGNAAGPLTVDDAIQAIDEDSPVIELDVLANDSDPDGDLTIVAVTQGSKGDVSIVDNRIRYEPHPNVSGADTFTYSVYDPGGRTETAMVFITIKPVNDNPALSDLPDAMIDVGGVYTVNFTVSDVETPASELTIAAQSSNQDLVPNSGISLTGTGSTRTLTITPQALATGTTTITIVVTDKAGGTDAQSFVLWVTQEAQYETLFLPMIRQ